MDNISILKSKHYLVCWVVTRYYFLWHITFLFENAFVDYHSFFLRNPKSSLDFTFQLRLAFDENNVHTVNEIKFAGDLFYNIDILFGDLVFEVRCLSLS